MDKYFPVRTPIQVVSAPSRLLGCDAVEIRVTLIPIRYDADSLGCPGDALHGSIHMVRVEATDARAVFYITQQLIRQLVDAWIGLK